MSSPLVTPLPIGVVLLFAALVGVGPGAQRAWADPDEAVTAFDAVADVDATGNLRVTETIRYRFAGTGHHGLVRELHTQGVLRAYPVAAVGAESPTGAPTQTAVIANGEDTTIRVGDPAQTVSGPQTYVLHYTLGEVVDTVSTPRSKDVLRWDFVGNGWNVPVEKATVRVTAARPADERHCAGGVCTDTSSGAAAVFSAGPLAPGEGLVVTLDYAAGTATAPARTGVAAAPPPSIGGRLFGWVMLLVVLGCLGGGAWMVARLLREPATDAPRPASGPPRHATGASRNGAELGVKAVPLPAGWDPVPDVPVPDELAPDEPEVGPALSLEEAGLLAPPSDLSPGLLGVLHAAGTGTAAVTATLLDLAVRGHLRIEEVAGPHSPADWSLVPAAPAARAACDPLLPHEEALLSAVLGGRSSPRLGTVCRRHTRDLDTLHKALVAIGVDRGWLADNAVARWGPVVGKTVFFSAFVAALVSFMARPFPYFFFCVAAAIVGGLLTNLFAVAKPVRRTRMGDAALAELRPYLTQLSGVGLEGIPPDRAAEVFSRSLPYAVAIGQADRWTSRCTQLFPAAPRGRATGWFAPAHPQPTGLDAITTSLIAFVAAADHRPAPVRRHGYSGFGSGFGSSSSSGFSSSSFDSGSSSSSGSSGGGSSW
jgi:uncharacterized membrane protein YgcG